jgi:phage tail tape-measure protein
MASLDSEHEETGRLAGLSAGVLAGARIGTALLPIPFVGTVTGAIIGGTLGSRFGRQLAPQIVKTFDSLVGGQPAAADPTASATDPASISADLLSQLERLGQLRTQGLVTDEEFTAAKARLLAA